jgi:UDP-3-O-[3-hydroxymyristoyl] N-acetylglucosamine deacetylase
MAALVAAGIDNAVVAVDGPEVPVLDGSAEPFLFLIDSAGTVPQAAPLRWIEVRRPVRVAQGEAFAELRPGIPADDHPVLQASLSISFAAEAIGRQALTLALDDLTVRHELARARTFTQAAEVEQLRAAGLALGGSLDNAVVVDGALVLNPTGLRMRDEFVRHKMLDMVGDLALAGTRLHGTVVASRTGHRLNNQLLQALFADPENWGWAEAAPAWAAIRAA